MSRSEKLSYILSSIHNAHFSGEFNSTDIQELQEALTSRPPIITHYDLLNAPNDTQTITVAKEKYRLLALRFHPDKTLDKQDHVVRVEIFKLIQMAYETLTDPQKSEIMMFIYNILEEVFPQIVAIKCATK